jgi:putative glycosyltransferase (TIGR04372 family)
LNIHQSKKKYLDFVYIHRNNKVFNKQIEKMWKRKLNFLPGYLLYPLSVILDNFPGGGIHSLEYLHKERFRNIDDLVEKCNPLEFTQKEEIYGNDILKKFGLKSNDKFVCLSVRDEGYQYNKIPARFRDWSTTNFRHTDIDKFLLAAKELANRGYYVFRMGVDVKKKMKSNDPKIIDYANSELRNDFMDIYLGAKCSFCVVTESGFQDLPCIFKKPMVQICVPIGQLFTYSERFLLITKHHFNKKEKRKLSLSEIFSHGLAYTFDTRDFEKKGIQLIDNTEEEIKDAVVEMTNKLEDKMQVNFEDKKLQEKFRNIYALNIKRYNAYKRIDKSNVKTTTILHDKIKSSFSTQFLKQNKSWLQ